MLSKQLQKKDTSGVEISSRLFDNSIFDDFVIEFDRIHYDFKENRWVIFEHLLIQSDISCFDDLSLTHQQHINKLIEFCSYIEKKSNTQVNLFINLFFPKEHLQNNKILILNLYDYSFSKMNLNDFSRLFRELNFYGEQFNSTKEYEGAYNNQNINLLRDDNSAFSLSKACLNGDVTYGFNLDKLLFYPNLGRVFVFEFLLCDEKQSVTPYSSHPNNYFYKNKKKFINLFNFTESITSCLYLINYAKIGTKHENKVKMLHVKNIEHNKVTTEDSKNITISYFRERLNDKFLLFKEKEHAKKQIQENRHISPGFK